jgi:TRAP-type uncharacterized transport system substrate-binding protein
MALMCAVFAIGGLAPPSVAAQATAYKIVTASERGTYIQIGRDLAKFVAPQAQIELDALPSAGSAENIHRLRYEPGVKLALVQSDVYQAFINQSNAGDGNAAAIIKPLRVIMPLYNEEVYFIVRADSPLSFVHEIQQDQRRAAAQWHRDVGHHAVPHDVRAQCQRRPTVVPQQ